MCVFISTHTPLTGCNMCACRLSLTTANFYSHTPHGVQHIYNQYGMVAVYFYSHTPHGVQQMPQAGVFYICAFLLTHPSRGATDGLILLSLKDYDFYSHTPHGVQLNLQQEEINELNFYSHTPHGVQPLPVGTVE